MQQSTNFMFFGHDSITFSLSLTDSIFFSCSLSKKGVPFNYNDYLFFFEVCFTQPEFFSCYTQLFCFMSVIYLFIFDYKVKQLNEPPPREVIPYCLPRVVHHSTCQVFVFCMTIADG